MIAFLHTSEIHIERFEDLVKKIDNTCDTKHYVNDNLLTYAFENGAIDIDGFNSEIRNIKRENPQLIICTCSTYGALCNEANGVKRIDFPIASYLVSNYKKIGLVFTATSTKTISKNLLQKIASQQQKAIEIINCDCSDAWIHFENNAIDKYEDAIACKVKEIANKVDVLFLAQASMEGAKKHLNILDKPVYTSPEFGVKYYIEKKGTF